MPECSESSVEGYTIGLHKVVYIKSVFWYNLYMNKIKFFLNLLLIPVYFLMLLVAGIGDAFRNAYLEVADGYRETKRYYGIK